MTASVVARRREWFQTSSKRSSEESLTSSEDPRISSNPVPPCRCDLLHPDREPHDWGERSGTIPSSRTARREDWSARGDRMARDGSLPERVSANVDDELRLPWSRSDRPVPRRLIRPIQAFFETELAGG